MANPTDKPATDTPADPAWWEQIIPEEEAARLRNVSVDTLRRQAKRGEGPKRLRLSPRRVGYKRKDALNP
jgi:hypothetical protein